MTQQFATIDRRTEVNHTPPLNRTHPTRNVMRKIHDVIENRLVERLKPASLKKFFRDFGKARRRGFFKIFS